MSGGTWGERDLARDYVAKVLRERRALLGLSKHEAARRTGIGHGCLTRYEKGLNLPSVHILIRLCEALHIAPGRLIDNLAGEIAVANSPRYAAPPAVPIGGEAAGNAAGTGTPPPTPSAGGAPTYAAGDQ